MNAHTPKDWSVCRHATPDYAPQYGIFAGDSQSDLAIVRGNNAESNAHLIASAPDLLSTLENLRNEAVGYLADLNRHGVDTITLRGAIKQAEAVIAKAKEITQ